MVCGGIPGIPKTTWGGHRQQRLGQTCTRLAAETTGVQGPFHATHWKQHHTSRFWTLQSPDPYTCIHFSTLLFLWLLRVPQCSVTLEYWCKGRHFSSRLCPRASCQRYLLSLIPIAKKAKVILKNAVINLIPQIPWDEAQPLAPSLHVLKQKKKKDKKKSNHVIRDLLKKQIPLE